MHSDLMANFWFKFEWDAWLGDRQLQRCSLETQGMWIKCICLMEEAGECFIEGAPEEVANLLGCSMEVFRRCVTELKRTRAAEVVAEKDYVKLLSRRLLKRVNKREYDQLKQQEHRRQTTVNVLSNDGQDPKSLRVLDKTSPNGEAPGAEPTCLPASVKPARKSADPRKGHPALICVLKASKRYPPKDLWDETITALGESPDIDFFSRSYIAWRSFGGSPTNYEAWLFEPARTGKIPERFLKYGTHKQPTNSGDRNAQRISERQQLVDALLAECEQGVPG